MTGARAGDRPPAAGARPPTADTRTPAGDARPPIVLVHGCGGSLEATFQQTGWMDALRTAGRSPLGLHLPGHGIIPAPRDPAHYADLATLLSEKLPAGVFDAVGFSLGSKLLLELATRSPARIRRLVLGGVGDNVFAPEAVADAAARALESGPTSETPGGVLEFLRRWEPTRNDALAVAAVLRRPPNPTFTEERLRTVTTPVLVINGSDDPVARRASRLLGSLPHARHHSISGVGHFDLPSNPEFLHAALTFLQEPNA